MNLISIKAGAVSFLAAGVASLCCLLPLAVVLLGLGSGAFMMVTMQYRNIFLPIGVLGVAFGYFLFFKERQRCATVGCAIVNKKINLMLLILATGMVGLALILDIFPEVAAKYLQMGM